MARCWRWQLGGRVLVDLAPVLPLSEVADGTRRVLLRRRTRRRPGRGISTRRQQQRPGARRRAVIAGSPEGAPGWPAARRRRGSRRGLPAAVRALLHRPVRRLWRGFGIGGAVVHGRQRKARLDLVGARAVPSAARAPARRPVRGSRAAAASAVRQARLQRVDAPLEGGDARGELAGVRRHVLARALDADPAALRFVQRQVEVLERRGAPATAARRRHR